MIFLKSTGSQILKFILGGFLLLPHFAWGQMILIRSAHGSTAEFQAELASRELDTMSFSEYMNKAEEREAKGRILREAFANLQAQYLSSPFENLSKPFIQFIQHAQSGALNEEIHSYVFYAYLRLAQISQRFDQKTKWFAKASDWSDSLSPDPEVFDPDFQRDFQNFIEQRVKKTTWIHQYAPQAKILRINGISYPVSADFQIHRHPKAQIQIQVYSDAHEPLKYSGAFEGFAEYLKRGTSPLTEGHCSRVTPKAFLKNLNLKMEIFKGKFCHRSLKEKNKTKKQLKDFKPQFQSQAQMNLSESLDQQPRAFYRSTWFWLGAGVLAGILIHNNQKTQDETTKPTVSSSEN